MDLIQIIILSLGLSMDSLIIALTCGSIICNHCRINVLKIAGMLGIIQLLFTVIGWFIGSTFADFIQDFDHWIAFVILLLLGFRVIYETLLGEDRQKLIDPLDIRVMFGLAVATSIDALAVGFTLSLINHPIIFPAIIIGIVTFILSGLGVVFGVHVGKRFHEKLNILGGLILILIGCSILFEHTM